MTGSQTVDAAAILVEPHPSANRLPTTVLILGASGMLGHKVWSLFNDRFDTYATVRQKHPVFQGSARVIAGVDAIDFDRVRAVIDDVKPDVIVNCVGIIKQSGEAEDAERMIAVNSLFPQRLAKLGVRLIHISTDCVFSGRRGAYSVTDIPDPVDLYGRSKLVGEPHAANCLTIRTSLIGRDLRNSAGLLEWFLGQRGKRVRGYVNAFFSGLTTQTTARIIGGVIERHAKAEGVVHVAGARISKYDLLVKIREAMRLDVEIEPAEEPRLDRSLSGSRFDVPSWDEMIAELAADPTPYDEWRSTHAAT